MSKTKTILITGPESSGKTTLSHILSEKFKVQLLPEYARTYLEQNGPEYEQSSLLEFAQQHQLSLHTLLEESIADPLILDTYLLNIKIWSIEKYGICDNWIEEQIAAFTPDIVLLCKPDIPWEPDPLRENPKDRDRLFEIFVKELDHLQWEYLIVDADNRENKIEESIKEFISKA